MQPHELWEFARTFGFGVEGKKTHEARLNNKRNNFLPSYAERLKHTNIENADALYIIKSRDSEVTFHYCDPPYVNSDCGEYIGYTEADFEALLSTLAGIKGKFMLSSYPSELLSKYTEKYGWRSVEIDMKVSMNNKNEAVYGDDYVSAQELKYRTDTQYDSGKNDNGTYRVDGKKRKTEVLTMNYNPSKQVELF